MCVFSVHIRLCVCVWGLPCSGHWLNCFHMCLNAEFWAGLEDKEGEGAAVGGVCMCVCVCGGAGGGFRFHSTMQHIWAARAELEFPRLKTHRLHTHTLIPRRSPWYSNGWLTHICKGRACSHPHPPQTPPQHCTHVHTCCVQALTHFLIYGYSKCCFLYHNLLLLALARSSLSFPHAHTHIYTCSCSWMPHKYTHNAQANITSSLAQLSQMLRAHRRFTGTTHGRKMWMCSH